jgi:hypothetical protein
MCIYICMCMCIHLCNSPFTLHSLCLKMTWLGRNIHIYFSLYSVTYNHQKRCLIAQFIWVLWSRRAQSLQRRVTSWKTGIRLPAGKNFSLCHFHIRPGVHPTSHTSDTEVFPSVVKRPEREANQTSASSSKVNQWLTHSSILLHGT